MYASFATVLKSCRVGFTAVHDAICGDDEAHSARLHDYGRVDLRREQLDPLGGFSHRSRCSLNAFAALNESVSPRHTNAIVKSTASAIGVCVNSAFREILLEGLVAVY